MHKKLLVLLLVSVGAIGIASCGSSSDSMTGSADTGGGASTTAGGGSAGGGQDLTVTADSSGALEWSPKTLSAKAGQVTITLDNPSSTPHEIVVEGNGVDKETDEITQSTTSLTADLKPGTYQYFCDVPGHKATMNGVLTVK